MIKDLLAEIISEPFSLSPVHGGDINEAYLVTTEDQKWFVKYHYGFYASDMFLKEKLGLELIEKAVKGFSPSVRAVVSEENHALLMMEYLTPCGKSKSCSKDLGRKLALMHQYHSDQYGLEYHNYIGKLKQYNTSQTSISGFMAYSRLEPQIKLARDAGLLSAVEAPSSDHIENILSGLIPEEKPCLIHGDLWGGNYLCIRNEKSMIIDPAVTFGHREMDIGMSRLFGGFEQDFYMTYNDVYPLEKAWKKRIDIFQLYYLLVHLNLFGVSYKGSVIRILKKYFS